MSNMRKTDRVKALTFTTVYDLHGHILLGFLGDLTLQGAMVVGEKMVTTNRDLTLGIEIQGAAEIPDGRLTIPAHVAWCQPEDESAYFHTGFEFVELSEQNKKIIETLVTKYKFSRKISS